MIKAHIDGNKIHRLEMRGDVKTIVCDIFSMVLSFYDSLKEADETASAEVKRVFQAMCADDDLWTGYKKDVIPNDDI